MKQEATKLIGAPTPATGSVLQQASRPAEAVSRQAVVRPPQAGQGMWVSLRGRDFRLYWGSSMAHMGAMNVQAMVQPWYMYELTKSAAMLGVAALASAIPMLLLSPLGGIIADKFQKKAILFVGQSLSGLLAAVIAVSIVLGVVNWMFLIVTAVIQGTLMAFMMPARQAMVREIVSRGELSNALALNNAGMNFNRLMAPALGGLLIGTVGPQAGYFVMAALFVVAVFLTAQLPTVVATSTREGFLAKMRNGIAYIREDKIILSLLLFTLGGVFLSMPYITLLPVYAKDVLGVGPSRLGLLMTASGGGALAASLAIASLREKNRGHFYLGSTLVLGGTLVAFSLSESYVLAMAWIVPVGIGQAGRMALSNILVQYYVDDAYRGRVMSIYLMEYGLTSLSTFGVAILAGVMGVQVAIGGTAALLVIFTLWAYLFVPRLRRLD